MRNLYLSNTPVDRAKRIYLEALAPLIGPQYETIPAAEALHRLTRRAVYANYSSPLYNCAAMDGIAVISKCTEGARETAPRVLREGGDYVAVDTGDPVRAPFDAVIMAEDIEAVPGEGGAVRIFAAAHPWQHVRPVGEDIVAGEMVLPRSHLVRPIDIGVLLSAGIMELEVVKKPRVAVFPTGTEIIEPGAEPGEGDIIESNSRMLEAMVKEAGGEGFRFPAIPDEREAIRAAVKAAAEEYDMVIVNAGSSAGREDYTVHVLRELGEVVVHGVAVKPGKPVILAIVSGKPVIGIPGYPVSAYIAFENFAAPVLALLAGVAEKKPETVSAIAAKRMVSSLKHREYVRVKAGSVDGRLIAAPLARGAGAAMSLVRADGFCVIEQNVEGVEAGEPVRVELYRSREEIERTLVITGSHDMILDVAADILHERFPGTFISSTHVGSMAGLMALRRGEAHVSPTHLLDEETGEYNISYIKRLFDEPMALIKGVDRIQGIMVKKGNPLSIKGIGDLARVRYVNRQRGAGTRVLLDHKLREAGVTPNDIDGYDREAATHMAVAALVAGESADAGMGILSAARAMDLDFIEIGPEEYDFALRQKSLELPGVKAFLSVITGDEFKAALDGMGGYGHARTGEIIMV